MLPILRFDPQDAASLRDLGLGLKQLLAAAEGDPHIAGLLRGQRTPRADLSRAHLPADLRRDMEQRGLLTADGDRVALPFQIRLVEDRVIVTDWPTRAWRPDEEVLDPLWGGPTLNKLLVRGAARQALDMGCGSGVMTLAEASYCDRVVGVDINPRAIAVSLFNVALNAVSNVTIVHSDLFGAVRGRRFDRIVFNSPTGFELRPRNWLEGGERILERFFSEVLDYLDEDGYLQVSLCFAHRRRSTFWARLNTWLDGRANQVQVVFLEQLRMDRGGRFFATRLLGSLKDRSNGFDVTSISRGWLVLKRGEPLALQMPINYKNAAHRLSGDFGDVLVRLLFESRGQVGPEDAQKRAIARPDVLADSLRRMEAIAWS